MYKIQTLNKISPDGLALFPRDTYEIASEILNPDAVLVRSAKMHDMEIPATVKAIARAGAGVNNIPVPEMTEKGIVVFNTPGANANAVKELVLAALLFSSRPVHKAAEWAKGLIGKGDEIPDLAEKGKSQFVGPEIRGKTLGVIGLGAIGAMVANDAHSLGMNVIGYDPFISVDAAWSLSRGVSKAESLDILLGKADYITIHVPQTNETKGFINAEKLKIMKNGVRILNFARGGLVNNADMIKAVADGKVACYVSDFADEEMLKTENVICLPHLGASTPEAEDNCATMAVNQLIDFLENGNIVNSVNFPKCRIDGPIPKDGVRLCIANKNVPNMIGQITGVLAGASLNIESMTNQNRADVAYNLIDVNSAVDESVVNKLKAIDGIITVRAITGREHPVVHTEEE
ncbi:MAG TPA: phosphoglycerate dehydrogenase [Treponemataceae bacterium]|jgi:D-3-phosphoglycerate dehydrogenase|nr:MAG: D-3-phosphoglycerate dehydrogenase [Spirochaetes bacterium ADurb.Bin215]HOF86209.1 phosphoglycerate dehydrogenase [Treponemataceae bacterium]HOS35716.1 phosphoglycerate dehydrogenase [Treponemataceae bacterium]HOU37800.1 phosphoglycerate dehydrogenase [Treponemataceae bacterium]HPA10329.1 phosphoglycerate dehydrogenase [Treponemataceae bacterium]